MSKKKTSDAQDTPAQEPVAAATPSVQHESAPAEPPAEEPTPAKSMKITYEDSLAREEAVAYFAAIVEGLRAGKVSFHQDDRHLELALPDDLDVEVKAARKGEKAKISFEISWRGDRPRTLAIVPG